MLKMRTHYFVLPSNIVFNNSYAVCENDSEKCLTWGWEKVLIKLMTNLAEENNVRAANNVLDLINKVKKS